MSHPQQSGPTADRPTCPVVGTRYFDSDLGNSVEWDGSTWSSMGGGGGGGVPVGTTVAAAGPPGVDWSDMGPYAAQLNMLSPLPVGMWYEKV